MLSIFYSREEFSLLPFVGVHLDLLTPSCIECVEGVIVFVPGCFLFVDSEVTYEEFLHIVVSPQTYFREDLP